MQKKVLISAILKLSCYNCLHCKDNNDNETGNSGHYSCNILNENICDYDDSISKTLKCEGNSWEWDNDDRGQKTLEDCSELKVMSIVN